MADVAKLVKEYQESDALLKSRITDTRYGFDAYDKMYQTYLDPKKWPYSVKLATPRGFTSIFNKTTRVIGGRFTGRVEAVGMGDDDGAEIATEHFKYSVERFNQYSDQSIEIKAAMWDTNCRLYGAGFLRTYWKTEYKTVKVKGKTKRIKVYDNWWVDVVNNRDLLLQPGRETLNNSEYAILRRYMSLDELEKIQEDGAGYDKKAMAEIKEAKNSSGKDANYVPVIKLIKNQDYSDSRIEVCTTYYKNKFVTWCPKHGSKGAMGGLILREIENPYRHQTIPFVPLIYIPSQEDIYGMSELQPVTALLKILSALQSQFVELVNKNLYPPTLVSVTESRIDTFKYRPKAFWLVNNPAAVSVLDTKASQSLGEFTQVYQMIVTEFLEALGETGTGVSQVDLMGGDKTATEVKDRAYLRGSRDNFNKMMLQSSLKKLMYQLFEMLRDPKFTDRDTVIKITGQEGLEYFDKQGYSSWGINEQGYSLVFDVASQLEQNAEFAATVKESGQSMYEMAYQLLAKEGALDAFAEPTTPFMTAKGAIEKLEIDQDRNVGYLHVDPETDYLGEFSFIPDVDALTTSSPEKEYRDLATWYGQAMQVEQTGALNQEGYRLKHKDILTKLGEKLAMKDIESSFEKVGQNEVIPPGVGTQGAMSGGQGIPGQQTIQAPPGAPIGQVGGGVPQTSGPGMAGAVQVR